MKKLSAILLIALFLFNLFGYRVVFNYEQRQSDKRLEASFDKQEYSDADLVAVKVPLSLPYINSQQNFERIDGEITVNGKILKYVKRRISNGNLILLCLPDHKKMQIESAKNDFFKDQNDLVQHNQPKKPSNSKSVTGKNILTECYLNNFDYKTANLSSAQTFIIPLQTSFLPPSHYQIHGQPPENV